MMVDPSSPQVQALSNSQMLESLEVEEKPFSRGGYASVYRAYDLRRGEKVVLKRPHDGDYAWERFKREIDALLQLGHKNIVELLDHDTDGFRWYTMPFAESNLRTHAPILDVWGRFQVVDDVCQGLAFAHSENFCHRDISPGNVLLFEGAGHRPRWAVSDFGLVRWPSHGQPRTALTRTGAGLGTPGFAAPEVVINAKDAGPAADVYSVGKLISWMEFGDSGETGQVKMSGPWSDLVVEMTEQQLDRRLSGIPQVLKRLAGIRSDLEAQLREAWAARRKHQLPQVDLDLLCEIVECDGPPTDWLLARESKHSRLDVRLALRRLTARGLVSREVVYDQEEYELLAVTDAGFDVLERNRGLLRPARTSQNSVDAGEGFPF